jgi:hypothetical protein
MEAQPHAAFNAMPSTESPERIRELLERNLQEVFGQNDARRRRAAIDELYAQDCILYAPPGIISGREEIDRFAGALRASHPEKAYTPLGMPQALQNGGRLAWGAGARGGEPDYFGWDVIIVRDGRIAALYVFLDETSAEFRRSRGHD